MYNNYMQPPYPAIQADIMQRLNQQQQIYNQQYGNQNQTMPSQPPTAPTSNVNWVQVNGIDGAKNITVQPNTSVWAMDNNEQIFYVRQADNMGICTTKAFRFSEIDLSKPQQIINTQDLSADFVPRSEFEELKNKIAQYEQLFIQQSKTGQITKPTKSNKEGNE